MRRSKRQIGGSGVINYTKAFIGARGKPPTERGYHPDLTYLLVLSDYLGRDLADGDQVWVNKKLQEHGDLERKVDAGAHIEVARAG